MAVTSTGLWHAIGGQLAHPRGWAGRLAGHVMGVTNRAPDRLVLESLDLQPAHRLLDVGCGAGHFLARAADRCRCVEGIDPSATMVAAATRRLRHLVADGRAAVRRARAEALPYPDGHFDRICASNVLYFWEEPAATLGELVRVLRPGGRVIVYVTDAASMQGWRFAATGTHHLYDERRLATLMAQVAGDQCATCVRRVTIFGKIDGLVATLERAPTVSHPLKKGTM